MKLIKRKEDRFFLCQNGDSEMILKKMGLVGFISMIIQIGLSILSKMLNIWILEIFAIPFGVLGGGLLGVFVATNFAETQIYKTYVDKFMDKVFGWMID